MLIWKDWIMKCGIPSCPGDRLFYEIVHGVKMDGKARLILMGFIKVSSLKHPNLKNGLKLLYADTFLR
jgi:hypothetical protein